MRGKGRPPAAAAEEAGWVRDVVPGATMAGRRLASEAARRHGFHRRIKGKAHRFRRALRLELGQPLSTREPAGRDSRSPPGDPGGTGRRNAPQEAPNPDP